MMTTDVILTLCRTLSSADARKDVLHISATAVTVQWYVPWTVNVALKTANVLTDYRAELQSSTVLANQILKCIKLEPWILLKVSF